MRVRRYGRTATGPDAAHVLDYPRRTGALGVLRPRSAASELELRLAVPGEHMALNALAPPWPRARARRAPLAALLDGLAAFDGVRRRFEFSGRADGVRVYDDYAHHPTKVAAQLRAARGRSPAGRAASSWPSSRTSTRAPATSPPSSAPPCRWPTRSWCSTSTAPARTPSPASPARWSPTPCRCPPERVHYVPRWAEVPGGAGRPRPSRRPRASPWARATSPCSAPRCCSSWSARDQAERRRAPGDRAAVTGPARSTGRPGRAGRSGRAGRGDRPSGRPGPTAPSARSGRAQRRTGGAGARPLGCRGRLAGTRQAGRPPPVTRPAPLPPVASGSARRGARRWSPCSCRLSVWSPLLDVRDVEGVAVTGRRPVPRQVVRGRGRRAGRPAALGRQRRRRRSASRALPAASRRSTCPADWPHTVVSR